MTESKAKDRNYNILQIVNKVQKTIKKKKLIESSSNILVAVSGGQDSIFLLFCLSLLQSQVDFIFKGIWCNHFWQTDSFYTTLHLTKSAQAFLSPTIHFIPLHLYSPLPLFQWRTKTKVFFIESFIHQRKSIKRDKMKRRRLTLASKIYPCGFWTEKTHGKAIRAQKPIAKHASYSQNTPLRKQKKFIPVLSESLARNWRHITIQRAYTFYNADFCVYGHSLSDRVETILFNLMRGAGSRGAASFTWKRRHSSFSYNKFYCCLEQFKQNTHW